MLEARREDSFVGIRAVVEQRVLEAFDELLERLLGKEPEVAHHVDLLGAVVEVVGERNGLRPLPESPSVDRGRDQLGRVAEQELYGIRDNEGRKKISEVLLEFLECFTDLGARSRVAHIG